MKLSETIGCLVCSIYEGKMLGYTIDAVFCNNYKKLSGFSVVNDDDEFNYFLPINQISSNNSDTFFVKNELSISSEFDPCDNLSLINKTAYEINGKKLGKILDLEINENYEVTDIILGKSKISPSNLFNVGQSVCFFSDDKKTTKTKYAPRKAKINNLSVKIMQISPIPEQKPKLPLKLTSFDTLSIIGKIASKTYVGKNNEIIIHKGQTITADTLSKAKLHGVYIG